MNLRIRKMFVRASPAATNPKFALAHLREWPVLDFVINGDIQDCSKLVVDNYTVLFTGGKVTLDPNAPCKAFKASRRAFLINLESRQCTHLPKLIQGRCSHASCVTRQKKAFVFGGYHRDKQSSIFQTLNSIEMIPLYPCKSAEGKSVQQEWKAFTIESLPARVYHVMSAVSDTTIMIVGGEEGFRFQDCLKAQFVDVEKRKALQTFSTEQVVLKHIS